MDHGDRQVGIWWAGGYTADAGGNAEGIRLLSAEANGHLLDHGVAGPGDSPSFLAMHPILAIVYAVHEARGTVTAYAASPSGRLTCSSEERTAGEGACHLVVDPSGQYLIVSCWGNGDIVRFRLDSEGQLTDRAVAEPAGDPHGADTATPGPDPDPYAGQSRRSRAHAAVVLHNKLVATTDLGYDLVRLWTCDSTQGLLLVQELVLPPGSGPRHLVEHPDGRLFVCTEYSLDVVTLTPRSDRPDSYAVTSIENLAAPHPTITAAGIALSEDATRLYIGLRGSDAIAVVAVDEGSIRVLGSVASGGQTPLYQTVAGRRLYVANLASGNIAVFDLDPNTGTPVSRIQQLPVPSPTMLLQASPVS